MIDSHCHLADPAFAEDRDAVLDRAAETLTGALCVVDPTDEGECELVPSLQARWAGLHIALGIHPHHAATFADRGRDGEAWLRRQFDATRVLAVGEIGLDYHYNLSPPAVQRQVFAQQLAVAVERDLPVIIHTREADADTVAILREVGPGRVRGVFHCFSGDAALAEQALDLGFWLSFSGIITFAKAEALRVVARSVPADRLLIETDCPYLAPMPHRGRRNEPAWVLATGRRLAELRQEDLDALETVTTRNFDALFGTDFSRAHALSSR